MLTVMDQNAYPDPPPFGGANIRDGLDTLIASLRRGERQAFLRYHELYRITVHAFICHLVGDERSALDLTAETFAAAYRQVLLLEGPVDLPVMTYAAALESCAAWLERATDGAGVEAETATDAAVARAAAADGPGRRAAEALGTLEWRDRVALLLYDLCGLDAARAAVVLGTTEEAAGAVRFQAAEQFRTAFEAVSGCLPSRPCRVAEQGAAGAVGRGLSVIELHRLDHHAEYCRSCRKTLLGWGAGTGLALLLPRPVPPPDLDVAPVFGAIGAVAAASGSDGARFFARPLLVFGRALKTKAAAYVLAAACLALAVGLAVELPRADLRYIVLRPAAWWPLNMPQPTPHASPSGSERRTESRTASATSLVTSTSGPETGRDWNRSPAPSAPDGGASVQTGGGQTGGGRPAPARPPSDGGETPTPTPTPTPEPSSPAGGISGGTSGGTSGGSSGGSLGGTPAGGVQVADGGEVPAPAAPATSKPIAAAERHAARVEKRAAKARTKSARAEQRLVARTQKKGTKAAVKSAEVDQRTVARTEKKSCKTDHAAARTEKKAARVDRRATRPDRKSTTARPGAGGQQQAARKSDARAARPPDKRSDHPDRSSSPGPGKVAGGQRHTAAAAVHQPAAGVQRQPQGKGVQHQPQGQGAQHQPQGQGAQRQPQGQGAQHQPQGQGTQHQPQGQTQASAGAPSTSHSNGSQRKDR
jgi:DNA-directed RNA polymerase specialized sigma24 family protein